jgi:hypothetical protein
MPPTTTSSSAPPRLLASELPTAVAAASANLADEPVGDIDARQHTRSNQVSDDLELLTWTLESGWLGQQTTKRAAPIQPDTLSRSDQTIRFIGRVESFQPPTITSISDGLVNAVAIVLIGSGFVLIAAALWEPSKLANQKAFINRSKQISFASNQEEAYDEISAKNFYDEGFLRTSCGSQVRTGNKW